MSVASSILDLARRAGAEFKAARALAAAGPAQSGVVTSVEIAALASGGKLAPNRVYTLTDDARVVVARSPNSFVEV